MVDDLRPRRSQQERRRATVAKLIDASVESLGEVGYVKTTIARVCQLSGVSQGGLARHFPTRLDLMVATAEAVGSTHLASFQERVARVDASTLELLRLLRGACRSPLNAAWYELFAAARTDEELRTRLQPVAARLHADIMQFSAKLPAVRDLPLPIRDTLLFTVIHLLDGEAMSAVVHAHPEQEELRLHLLVQLIESAARQPLVEAAG